ncbi:MAG: AI-2E family transporter [Acidimicrobiales bacterium]
MAARPGTLRVSARSIVLVVVGLGLTLLALRMAVAAQRVLGWIAAASSVALLLTPIVERLRRRMPRGLAVAAVALVVLGGAGLAGYGVGASLVRQYASVREAAPRAAERLERSPQFGDVARDTKLSQRSREFVDAIPERLRGGSPAEAVRAAATRGVAFVATGILALFFLLHGPRLLAGAVRQLPGSAQARVGAVGSRAVARASGYALATLAQAVVAGLVGYGVARLLAVPGAAALGLWLGLWAVVPLVGSFVGALPIVAIAAAQNPSHGAAAAAFFVVYQIVEGLVSQRQIERRTMRLGPFLTTLAGAAGLELYGLGGALVFTLALALAVAALLEVAGPPEPDPAGSAATSPQPDQAPAAVAAPPPPAIEAPPPAEARPPAAVPSPPSVGEA